MANCAACEHVRREKEESGPVSQDDADRVSRLLRTDLAATVGNGHEAVVEEAVARIRLFAHDAVYFEQQVVDEVQQYLHDSFVDTNMRAVGNANRSSGRIRGTPQVSGNDGA